MSVPANEYVHQIPSKKPHAPHSGGQATTRRAPYTTCQSIARLSHLNQISTVGCVTMASCAALYNQNVNPPTLLSGFCEAHRRPAAHPSAIRFAHRPLTARRALARRCPMDYQQRRSLAARLIDAALYLIRGQMIHDDDDPELPDTQLPRSNQRGATSKESRRSAESREYDPRDW